MPALTRSDRTALADLLRAELAVDPVPFLSGWVVLPEAAYFPDRWSPSVGGLTRLARRLHLYLGISEIRPVFEVQLEDEGDRMLRDTRAALQHLEGNTAAYLVLQLHRADDAALALLHETARAAVLVRARRAASKGPFRDAEESAPLVPEEDEEAHLIASVRAISSGLGALVCLGAHQYRAVGRVRGRQTETEWQHLAFGGISPQAASYLFALQLAVRTDVDRDAVLLHLPKERADEVRSELAEIDRAEAIAELGLPDEDAWPAPRALPVPAIAEDATDEDVPITREHARRQKARARRSPVYRVRDSLWRGGAMAGVALGALSLIPLNLLLGRLVGDAPVDGLWFGVVLAVLGGATFLGARLGARRVLDDCSDRDCEARIPERATECPGCGRTIAGVVRTRGEAIEREEAWEDAEKAKKRASKKKGLRPQPSPGDEATIKQPRGRAARGG
jgi:hypothetical protein